MNTELDTHEGLEGPKRFYSSEMVTSSVNEKNIGDHDNEPTARRKNTNKSFAEMDRNLKFEDSGGQVIVDGRWITFPGEPTISFPEETFTPKVQMEIGAELNGEIERLRRLYESFRVEDLLEKNGITSSDMSQDNYLSLDIFDDEEYDCRTPEEWMGLGLINEKQHPLPAQALLVISDKPLEFSPVAVVDYNRRTNLWEVFTLNGKRSTFYLTRLYLRFYAEDPRVFVNRIINAVYERNRADASIRYNLYLDCMPTQGLDSLSDQEKSELKRLSVRKVDRRAYLDIQIASVIREVERNYLRIMCDLECRRLLHDHPAVSDFLSVHSECSDSDCKQRIFIPRAKGFQEIKELLHWNTLYVQTQIYDAMQAIVTECQKIAPKSLFFLRHGRAISIDEFETQQSHSIHSMVNFLKNQWLKNIIQSIRIHLKNIGKGWFDLKQKNYEIFEVMKLKRLIELAKQHMQSAIRSLVENSATQFLKFFETPTLTIYNLKPDFVWDLDFKTQKFESTYSPIFEIDVYMNEEGSFFTTDPNSFEVRLDTMFCSTLQYTHQIKQIKANLLKNLKFSNDLYISSVSMEEPLIYEVRERIKTAYAKSTIPLFAYLKKLDKYHDLFLFDSDNYVERFKNSDYTISLLKQEVLNHYSLKEDLEKELPHFINIGAIKVNLEKLRKVLINKRQNIINSLLGMHTKYLNSQIEDILDEFKVIYRKLTMEPEDIEQVYELRDWMEGVPITLTSHSENFQKLKLEYDVLESLLWNIPDNDFESRYDAMGFPFRIKNKIDQLNVQLASLEKDKFLVLQLENEADVNEKIDSIVGSVQNISVQTDIKKISEIAKEINQTWNIMKELQEFTLVLNSRQKLFGIPVVPFSKLQSLIKDFEPYKNLWLTINEWLKWHAVWMDDPLVTIDGTGIDIMVNDMYKMMGRCIKIFHDVPALCDLAEMIKDQIEYFKPYISIIQSLRNPGIKVRHLDDLTEKTGINISMSPDLTFKILLSSNIMEFQELIKETSETAAKEFAIEEALAKMKSDWEPLTMEVSAYKNTGTYTMKIADEIQLLLDDHVINTQQISFSPFKDAFKDEVDEWTLTLKLTQEVTGLWMEVQKLWMYLEPIFSSPDISQQLPVESKKYNTLDRNWRRIMKVAFDNPYIIKVCPDKTLRESLKECMNLLEIVQKGLSDYLESRRMLFPRFFFLSDDELLEILAQTKNVQAVQPHLKKCFENMKELRFEEDLTITRMYSAEGEEVILNPPVKPIGSVEYWLNTVESSMKTTIRFKISQALKKVEKLSRKDWVYLWPGQVSLCGGQTSWTAHVEKAIKTHSLKNYLKVMISQLDDLRTLVRGQQTEIQRLMVEAIITIEVHARDVLLTLIEGSVSNVNDFDWISQLRYYWVDNTDLKVRAVNAEFQYGYEYLGNNGRLVITPLTDRCYLTLTGALHLKFGGAPAGPAGTGKTETTKDLAKALAIQCVVFNCSDQLDFMSMGKFFKGLASSGAWACFDEFNRIDVEVLSVIAQQIMTIQKAQQMQAETFIFEGVELRLRPSCAAFITMNPGYAGRTELPDNLKALFRPVAMMVPNYTLIAEISLFSCGFAEAKTLAAKITATFKLSSEQLSSQDHYDFGMRSVKTVIAVAGILKREQKDMEEPQICLRALRDVNVPKFLKDDLKLFNGIVSDLFPQIVEKEIEYDLLIGEIKQTIKSMGLAPVPEFIKKIIQLYETTIVRHGLMLVGPTGSGKTRCYQVLKKACTNLNGKLQPSGKPFTPVHTYVLNPKSITMGQLYGEYDLSTHEWTDGILSSLIRDGTTATDADKRWYVFDGPVDAVWIENMNTVLDDNKKLCLSSGEIMRLLPTQTMMFEVADLRVASPATVSRCGMVYMEPIGLGINPFIDCWIERLDDHVKPYAEQLSKLAYFFIIPALTFLRDNLKEIVSTVDAGLVQAYINLMNYQILTIKNSEEKGIPVYLLEPWSAFALIWSIGATCDCDSRYLFNQWLREMQKKGEHKMPFPPDGLVYDYKLAPVETGEPGHENQEHLLEWVRWLEDAPLDVVNIERKFSDIEIATIDMVRSSALIDYLLLHNCNVLCVGPTGSGKTLTVSAKLSRDMPKRFICDFINFSARTSANQTQDLIDSKLDKRHRGVYGPPVSKNQIFFIDDLNMPAVETYGAQPPIELLRQFMDFKGWYDRKEIGSFRAIEDVTFICAMAPPGGGRNPVTARLLRHFHFLAFPEMEDETKRSIFGTILFSWLAKTESLEEFSDPLVSITMKIYSTICQKLLPTPDKSHYTFNLRNLAQVFQGILMAEPEQIEVPDDLLFLWYHENFRIYSDRLTNDIDRNWFKNLLQESLLEQFNFEINKSLPDDNLFYGDFCSSGNRYERIRDKKNMKKTLLDFLEDYNSSTTMPMNLVLFEDAISHICRITRILRQSPGNALLLGMGGSGRQSLTKLSAHIAEYFCFQIELTRTYSTREWRDDVKSILLKTGLHNKHTVFLFSDTQIKSDLFLEDLNNILSSGDVANIYQPDEMDRIFQAMRPFVQESGLQITRSNLLAAFCKVIRNNMHTVISMCPIGEQFRARMRQFPAFINMCTIDWFDPWPDIALQNVAMHFLGNVRDEAITDTVLKSIVKTCQFIHSSVIKASEDFAQELNRHNYVTPTSYLELISSYGDLLNNKRNELTGGITRLMTGLQRLATTEIEVKDLQIVLEKMKPDLEKAAQSSAKMIEQISRDTSAAEVARLKAEEQENEASKLKKENQAIKDEAEADLSTARPLLEQAEESLKSLNKGDITEVKAMKRPPVGVILVIEAICIIKKVKPHKIAGDRPGQKLNDYWTPGSQLLADAGQFLSSLEKYNKNELNDEIINKLKVYIENPNFQPKKVSQVSKACHSLCLWVHAMYNYYFVHQRVAPKMAALAQAEKDLAKTEAMLAKAMDKLKEVQDGLDFLQFKFETEEKKKAELERQKQLCEDRMVRAVRLITGLAGEQVRWLETVADIRASLVNIVGDILLSAGAIAYLTPFIDTYRKRLLTSWYEVLGEGVPHTPGCSPISVLGDAVQIRKWQIDGLPRDNLSVENAVLVTNSKRWPLFIDPQGQANRWIRNVGKIGGVSTVRMTDKDLLRVIESCVRFGRTCLIENVGLELEAALDSVLMRSLFRQAGVMSIKIGDNIVPYNYDFRLYLTTKLPNPHYAPEVAVKVLLVNFTLTASGLADQMLSLVVMQERPELEETRSALVVSSAQMKHDLKEIEDRILYRLSLSEGSPVDDIDLILTLEASKVKSAEIKIKVEAAEATQADIDAARSLYIPVANRAQILFFCLLDLQLMDPMYQYSLEWFIRIFVNAMTNTEKNDDVDVRGNTINEFFTFSLYINVCRSLFEKHKLHFAFLLCIRIQMMGNLIDHGEWRFLLSGAIPPEEKPNPAESWLSQRSWMEIQSLEVLPAFEGFVSFFQSKITEFKKIFDSQQPETISNPEPWHSSLNDFQKMLIIKCLRPDKVTNVMQSYITKYLGSRFIEPHTAALDALYEESSPTTPLIFVLSTGTDPASELYKFADKLKMSRKLFSISLGQGQGPKAELMLKQSIAVGNWLFFQNCHLAPSWMPKLEILVEQLPPDIVHRDFRLWLTSMPSPAFPVSILQNGSKMTIEPPRGVKANVLRTYTARVIEMEEFLESENPKVPTFKSLIFSLCLFHAVLVERRKFGALGFNIPYEFTDGDFAICMSQLHMFLLEYVQTPFKVLIYTAGHINYGGRITDDWDRRCVLTILQNFYNVDVLKVGHSFDAYGNYRQPPTETTFEEYLEVIKAFPINDDPVLFGLHNNADISYAQAETYACLATLLALQPRDIGGAVSKLDEVTSQLARNILDGLPKPFNLRAIQKKYPISYEESLNTVLLQEASRYNVLLIEMSGSLKDLLNALKGLVVMSDTLEAMASSMYSNKVPANWQTKAFASLKPLGPWVDDLRERIKFIKDWQDNGIPAAFWISGFYFPQAFLTGTLQNYARKNTISIDSLDFGFKVLASKPPKRPKDGCAVYGLFLEGCRWDGTSLAESFPKELYTNMPPIQLTPEVNHKKAATGIYECPVYKTVQRAGTLSTTGHSTNFILTMEIPTRIPQAHWIVRGVALICALDF